MMLKTLIVKFSYYPLKELFHEAFNPVKQDVNAFINATLGLNNIINAQGSPVVATEFVAVSTTYCK